MKTGNKSTISAKIEKLNKSTIKNQNNASSNQKKKLKINL